MAAVAAVGAAARDELLAAEAQGAAAAVAGGDVDVDFVDKHVSRQSSVGSRSVSVGSRQSAVAIVSRLEREDADDAAARAVVLELDRAVDLREQRVVLAEADVQAGTEPAAALAHEDRSAGDDVAVEPLDAEALRIAVAPVAGTALTLFCCHDRFLAVAATELPLDDDVLDADEGVACCDDPWSGACPCGASS